MVKTLESVGVSLILVMLFSISIMRIMYLQVYIQDSILFIPGHHNDRNQGRPSNARFPIYREQTDN